MDRANHIDLRRRQMRESTRDLRDNTMFFERISGKVLKLR